MWIWWLISLMVLVACVVFAYRMIISTNDFLPAEKRKFVRSGRGTPSQKSTPSHQQTAANPPNKLQSSEASSSFYDLQFSKLQHRITALEELCNIRPSQQNGFKAEPEEDWKEMYYQENEKKERLENELDEACQKLDEYKTELALSETEHQKWIELQSNYDTQLNDLQSLQNTIELMQRRLEAAANRERELDQMLLAEIEIKKKYTHLESKYARVQSEADNMRQQIADMSKKEKEFEAKLVHLNQLESKITLYEEEKSKMISRLELMASQNKIFS